jgi:hypothetical protein
MPYNDFRTNVLAIGSQTILVRNLCPAGMAVQLSTTSDIDIAGAGIQLLLHHSAQT